MVNVCTKSPEGRMVTVLESVNIKMQDTMKELRVIVFNKIPHGSHLSVKLEGLRRLRLSFATPALKSGLMRQPKYRIGPLMTTKRNIQKQFL